jgi:hypothetical protein
MGLATRLRSKAIACKSTCTPVAGKNALAKCVSPRSRYSAALYQSLLSTEQHIASTGAIDLLSLCIRSTHITLSGKIGCNARPIEKEANFSWVDCCLKAVRLCISSADDDCATKKDRHGDSDG